MKLYRALYRSPAGQERRITFAAACCSEAQRFAELVRAGSTLETVETLRAMQRPIFNLTEGETA